MSFLNHLLDAPLANILILSGLFFLGIGAVGKIAGKIEPDKTGRIMSGLLGLVLLIIGLSVHIKNDSSNNSTSNQESLPIQPLIHVFSATPSRVTKGGNVTIRWEVSNADDVELEPFGRVDATGSTIYQPQQTTVFRLNAANKSGGKSGTSVEVIVDIPKPQAGKLLGPQTPTPDKLLSALSKGNAPIGPVSGGAKPLPCTLSYPGGVLRFGTRVIFVTSSDPSAEGAEVLLDGRCQGTITREAPGRDAYSLMLTNIPLGTYQVNVRQKGYPDIERQVQVPASNQPPEETPKVVIRFALAQPPSAQQFVGLWRNVAFPKGGWPRLSIRVQGDLILISVCGNAEPPDCHPPFQDGLIRAGALVHSSTIPNQFEGTDTFVVLPDGRLQDTHHVRFYTPGKPDLQEISLFNKEGPQ